MTPKQKRQNNTKYWLIPRLRRISMYWPPKNKALQMAKVKVLIGKFKNGNDKYATKYKCANCNKLFDKSEVQMDHRQPVVDIRGFINWDQYIESLFCSYKNYDCLCKSCHQEKTLLEQKQRK